MANKKARRKKSRQWFCIAAVLMVLCGLFAVGMYAISNEVNKNKEKIATTLQQELGFPLTFETIKTRWFGLSFGVLVENVKIIDSSAPIPFIAVDKIGLIIDLQSLFFERALQFKKVILQGLKLVIRRDKTSQLSVVGLQGEAIPTNVEYASLMRLLRKQPFIVIQNAAIEWQNSDGSIRQWLEGELRLVGQDEVEWILEGKQQLQIREGLILPVSNFKVSVSPWMHKVSVHLKAGKAFANCIMTHAEEGWGTDCELQAKHINLAAIGRHYVPKSTDPEVLRWLANAIKVGMVNTMNVNINGPLSALQWTGDIQFADADCLYTQNWPKLERASGLIKMENEGISISLSAGKIMGVKIEAATAIIKPDDSTQEQTIFVEGALNSVLEKGLLFLQEGPLRKTIGLNAASVDLSGFMRLRLKLKVSLTDSQPVQVEGVVSTQNAQLTLPDEGLTLTHVGGECHFTERGMEITDAHAFWDQRPLDFTAKTIDFMNHPGIEVIVKGKLDSDFLYQSYPLPLLKKFKGESMFALTIRRSLEAIPALGTEWELQSDLHGISIELPQFLGKTSGESSRTTVKMIEKEKEHRIALNVENKLDAKWVMDGSTHRIKYGNMVLGKGTADWQAKNAFIIRGELDRVNVREWYEDFGALQNDIVAPDLPDIGIDVLVQALDIYGLELNKTWIATTLSTGTQYPWNLDGPIIKGNVSFQPDPKRLEIDLDYLKIANKNLGNSASGNRFTASPFLVSFACQDLQYEQSRFGAVSFRLSPKSYGYEIQDLKSETKIAELSGNGEWHIDTGKPYTLLHGRVISTDMGEWFAQLGYANAIQDPSGYIDYQFKWDGDPTRFNLSRIEGAAELKFDKGRILGIKPGLGRIMGLLNVASIKRRLQLDFSDVFKQGFVFDTMRGTLAFQKGTVRTEQLLIDGPSAKIELLGSANLTSKAIDLNMQVTPHLGMSVPIMAAIAAGNPAVGAGVWIIDKLTGSNIKKMTRHVYQVTGTWDAPAIQELDKRIHGAP